MTLYELTYDLQNILEDHPDLAEKPVNMFIRGFEDTHEIELKLPAEFQIKSLRAAQGGVLLFAADESFGPVNLPQKLNP